jgi:epoxyqueuosine reductase
VKDDPDFRRRQGADPADLISLLGMDDAAFDLHFSETPLARPARAGLLRNAAIALGNQRAEHSVPALHRALSDGEPLVRGAAAWALGAIGGAVAVTALKSRAAFEDNATVLGEISQALETASMDRRT